VKLKARIPLTCGEAPTAACPLLRKGMPILHDAHALAVIKEEEKEKQLGSVIRAVSGAPLGGAQHNIFFPTLL